MQDVLENGIVLLYILREIEVKTHGLVFVIYHTSQVRSTPQFNLPPSRRARGRGKGAMRGKIERADFVDDFAILSHPLPLPPHTRLARGREPIPLSRSFPFARARSYPPTPLSRSYPPPPARARFRGYSEPDYYGIPSPPRTLSSVPFCLLLLKLRGLPQILLVLFNTLYHYMSQHSTLVNTLQ